MFLEVIFYVLSAKKVKADPRIMLKMEVNGGQDTFHISMGRGILGLSSHKYVRAVAAFGASRRDHK